MGERLINASEAKSLLVKLASSSGDAMLVARANAWDFGQLSDEELGTLRDLVGSEISRVGFDKDWNHTQEGWELESLMDWIVEGISA